MMTAPLFQHIQIPLAGIQALNQLSLMLRALVQVSGPLLESVNSLVPLFSLKFEPLLQRHDERLLRGHVDLSLETRPLEMKELRFETLYLCVLHSQLTGERKGGI